MRSNLDPLCCSGPFTPILAVARDQFPRTDILLTRLAILLFSISMFSGLVSNSMMMAMHMPGPGVGVISCVRSGRCSG